MLLSKLFARQLHGGLRGHVKVAEEVRHALEEGKPVVALESTIITHGMPHPINVECAMGCERKIRENGAIPATIAILKGKVTVGLSQSQIETIGDVATTRCVKTSRRDFPYVVGNKMNGGTTVSGTLIAANLAGIPIFATGGIGGVHRMGETTMDVSADLVELGRTPIAVVSSGIKSILDIPRTLEYLETQGVFVATFGSTNQFPAFYTRDSGCKAPYSVATAEEAAGIIRAARELQLTSGMLFGVPIPQSHAMDEKLIDGAIEEALKLAEDKGITGKEVTPFLLSHISKVTAGSSLESNIALVQNNAKIAAQIAYALYEKRSTTEEKSNVVVIGGSVLDRCATTTSTNLKLDGSIYTGKISENPGGVARNICEALGKLGSSPTFITAIGDDESGDVLARSLPTKAINRMSNSKTAQCVVLIDGKGDCNMLVGDMEVHSRITPELIKGRETDIQMAPLIVLDGNPPLESVEVLLGLAAEHGVPVFYEPTDVPIATKPFKTPFWSSIKFITPNVSELKQIASHFNIPTTSDTDIPSVASIARKLATQIDNVIVTMGELGILIARRGEAKAPLSNNLNASICVSEVQVRLYPALNVERIVNVSGAGDCFAAGLIVGVLRGLSEEECVEMGLKCAAKALGALGTVPEALCDVELEKRIEYNVIQ